MGPRRVILATLRVDAVAWPHLIKVGNDLVEEPQTLNAHVVAIQFYVEVIEVGDGGEHDAHLGVGLVIEVLQRQKGSDHHVVLDMANQWEQLLEGRQARPQGPGCFHR